MRAWTKEPVEDGMRIIAAPALYVTFAAGIQPRKIKLKEYVKLAPYAGIANAQYLSGKYLSNSIFGLRNGYIL